MKLINYFWNKNMLFKFFLFFGLSLGEVGTRGQWMAEKKGKIR